MIGRKITSPNRKDQRIVDFLFRQAVDHEGVGKHSKAKICAAVTHGKEVISLGRNQLKSHPIMWQYGKNEDAIFLHAETHAIVNSLNHLDRDDFTRTTMYVIRVKRSSPIKGRWVLGLSKPCEGCQSAIHAFGFKRVVWCDDHGDLWEYSPKIG